jgi:endonuclease/exonuclease/phosphatase family metal-dependent hydrolase
MSENIYLGADVVPVIRAAFFGRRSAIVKQVTRLWQSVLATNFPERADVIVRQIIENRADFVALQEVALFRTGIPDGLDGNQEPAEHVELDYLQILLDKLTVCGVPYTAVAVVDEADIELPGCVMPTGPCGPGLLRDIRLTDRLAILVRDELIGTAIQVSNEQGGRFDAKVAIPIGLSGQRIKIYRGWNSVDVVCGKSKFRLINMCLETNPFPFTQTKQAKELLCGPARTELPVILVGDSNSDANTPFSLAYHRLVRSGFRDAWTQTHRRDPGYTYGNDPDLRNPIAMTHHPLSCRPNRFDQVLCRGQLAAKRMKRVGVDSPDRTITGMWPSDHAGVIAIVCVGQQ